MVRHDVRQLAEPEVGHLVQHAALGRDRLAQDNVERREAVGGDDQQLVVANGVVVADLAMAEQRQGLDGGLIESLGHGGVWAGGRAKRESETKKRRPRMLGTTPSRQ
ncbi:hypothetical protein D3C86_1893680 [compost metagenome]